MTPEQAMEVWRAALTEFASIRVNEHADQAAAAVIKAAVEAETRGLREENERLKDRLFMSIPIAGNHPLRPGSGGCSARALLADQQEAGDA